MNVTGGLLLLVGDWCRKEHVTHDMKGRVWPQRAVGDDCPPLGTSRERSRVTREAEPEDGGDAHP